jgi:clan AA aspartic protease (TIGR02281 family)
MFNLMNQISLLRYLFAGTFFFFGLLVTFPVLSQDSQPLPTNKPTDILQEKKLGQELFKETISCILGKIPNPAKANQGALQSASMQCVFRVAVIAKDGSVRPDASDRMTALIKALGISVPKPVSKGQANIALKKVPESKVFSVAVKLGTQTKNFLFDTGASASIVDSQIAKKLGLQATPIASDILQYTVVGNDCSKIQANFHPLPGLTVNTATVNGLNGLGLPQTSIPGKLSGVLGLDFLSNFDMRVNPSQLQLELLPPSPDISGAIPIKGKLGNVIAEVKVNGKGPFNFLLDTGADTMVISSNLAKKLGIDSNKAEKTQVTGFCGLENARKIKLSQVSVQQHQANQLDGVILESNNIFNILGVDGIIGQNFLNKYQQHWRFGKRDELGYVESGSLVLTPIK